MGRLQQANDNKDSRSDSNGNVDHGRRTSVSSTSRHDQQHNSNNLTDDSLCSSGLLEANKRLVAYPAAKKRTSHRSALSSGVVTDDESREVMEGSNGSPSARAATGSNSRTRHATSKGVLLEQEKSAIAHPKQGPPVRCDISSTRPSDASSAARRILDPEVQRALEEGVEQEARKSSKFGKSSSDNEAQDNDANSPSNNNKLGRILPAAAEVEDCARQNNNSDSLQNDHGTPSKLGRILPASEVERHARTTTPPENLGATTTTPKTIAEIDNYNSLELPGHMIMPAERQRQPPPESLVGAWASAGVNHDENDDLVEEQEIETAEDANDQVPWDITGRPSANPEGLAVANLVKEEDEEIVMATPHEGTNSSKEKTKRFKTKVLLGILLFLVILMIVLAFTVVPNKSTQAPTMAPSTSPSEAPTAEEQLYLSLFPDDTVAAILDDADSPQSRAFQWLMEEVDNLPYLSDERILQRFVMATFYMANSEEEHWAASDHWLNHSVHECDWYTNLNEQHVYADLYLVLPMNHISPCEQDPSVEMDVLQNENGTLYHFWISNNNLIGGGIPPELYLLTDLRSLVLDGLNMSSTIPDELFVSLTNLEFISLMGNDLSGSIPKELNKLTRLQYLYLGFNYLTGVIPPEVYSLSNTLQGLILLQNQLTGPVPSELGGLTNLREVLGLDHNHFTGMIPSELGLLTSLKGLILHNVDLSGTIPKELSILTNLERFEINNAGLTGTLPLWIGNMTNMIGLNLDDNSLTGTIPTEYGLLTNSQFVGLHDLLLTGTIPSEFGNLKGPYGLYLGLNNLTSTIPTELGRLSSLWQLFLNHNQLTGTVPLELANISFSGPWGMLLLDANDLSGIIPEGVCDVQLMTFDCSSQLCGCSWCNCSNFTTMLAPDEKDWLE